MAKSTSEVGHAKNVANFEDLISYCKGYGPTYQPTNPSLSIASLTTQLAAAQSKLQAVVNAHTAFTLAIDARQAEFKDLAKLAVRVVSAIQAGGLSSYVVQDANTIKAKITGTRLTKAKTAVASPPDPAVPAPTAPATHSTSQKSYDQMIAHFTALAQLLTQNPTYNPNEPELKTTAINTKLANLKAKNTAHINAYTTYSNALIDRDTTLYHPTTGLVQASKDVKAYVKSIFGTSSPQYRQIYAVKLRNFPYTI